MSSQIDQLTPRRPRCNATALAALGASALAFAAAGAALAQAPSPIPPGMSVSYTLTASESGLKGNQGALKTEIDTTGPLQRYDTSVKLPNGNLFHLVNLLDSTAGKLTTIDPDLNIYAVSDASQVRPEIFGTGTLLPSYTTDGRGLLFPLPDLIFAKQSGGVGANVVVTDKGMEPIGKTKNAHHYNVALTYSTSGAAEVPYPSQSFDVWTDDTQVQPLNGIDSRLLSGGASGAPVGGVTYSLTGDVDKLRAVLTAVPVQITYDSGGAAGVITYTLDKLSDKPIDAKRFAVPSGKAQQVSAADFQQRERAALIARIQNSNNGVDDSSAGVRKVGPTTDPNTQGLNVPRTLGGGQ